MYWLFVCKVGFRSYGFDFCGYGDLVCFGDMEYFWE